MAVDLAKVALFVADFRPWNYKKQKIALLVAHSYYQLPSNFSLIFLTNEICNQESNLKLSFCIKKFDAQFLNFLKSIIGFIISS
jgi:hypothetical protein